MLTRNDFAEGALLSSVDDQRAFSPSSGAVLWLTMC